MRLHFSKINYRYRLCWSRVYNQVASYFENFLDDLIKVLDKRGFPAANFFVIFQGNRIIKLLNLIHVLKRKIFENSCRSNVEK